jgi:elongation factor G
MKVYQTNEIRNVSLIGGPGSGKTTLAECFLFEGGIIDRKGNVESKNTVSDYRAIEHERLNSVYSTVLYTEYNDHKINFIDNPGFDDFVGETIAAMKVTDVSLLLMNTNNGIEVGTELSWRHALKYEQPVVLVANHLDHEKAEFDDVIKEAKDFFGNKVTVVQYPYNGGKDFDSIIDVLTMKLYKYPKDGGKPEILDIPEEELAKAEELQNALVEAAAENDEALMELFFDKGTLNEDEMRSGIKLGLINRDIFPVFCAAAKQHIGITRLLEFIIKAIPSPAENPMQSDKGEAIECDSSKPATLFVYKTAFEEHLGEVSFMKVVSGEVSESADLENVNTSTKERISQLYVIAGKKREKVEKVSSGDFFATIKLKNTKTNNTLVGKGAANVIAPIDYPEPKIRTAVKAVNTSDDEKLAAVLLKMNVADPTLIFEFSKELKQMLIHGQGELHINIAKWHLEQEHKIPVEFFSPRISYRETITKQTLSDYRHKKQSGGAGQFGEVYIMMEPYEEGMPEPEEKSYNIRNKDEINYPGVVN